MQQRQTREGALSHEYVMLAGEGSASYAQNSLYQWLSKIPKQVQDINSAAWNKNSIQCTGLIKEVVVAYEAQYKKDVAKFLRARAQEIVHGGLMVIVAPGLPDGVITVQSWHGVVIEFISTCLIDMTKSGHISEEKVNSFNLPMYYGHASELKEVIEQNRGFCIERMETFTNPTKDLPQNMEFVISMFRAVLEGVIKAYFGHDTGNRLFQYCEEKIVKFPPDFKECHKNAELFFVLKRI